MQRIHSVFLLLTLTLALVTPGSCRNQHKKKGAPLSRFCHVIYTNSTEVWNDCYPRELLVCEPVMQALLPSGVYSASVCKARPCRSNNVCPVGSTCSSGTSDLPRDVAEQCGMLSLYYAEKWNKFINKLWLQSTQMRCSLPGSVMVTRKACRVQRVSDLSTIRTQTCRPTPDGRPVRCSNQHTCHVNVLGEDMYLYFCPKPVSEQITGDEINKDDEQDNLKNYNQNWRHHKGTRDGLRCCS